MLLTFLLANSSLNSDIRFVSISYALERISKDSCYARDWRSTLYKLSLWTTGNEMEVLFFLFKVIVRLFYLYLFVYILQFISHLIVKLLVYDLILWLTQSKLERRYLHYVHFGSNLEWCCHVLKLKILISNSSRDLFIDTNMKMGNILG